MRRRIGALTKSRIVTDAALSNSILGLAERLLLANPMLWTNHTQMVDVSFNWYLNKFVKVYFHSDHAIFGYSVLYNTDRFQQSNDLYWLRLPVYFWWATAWDRPPCHPKASAVQVLQGPSVVIRGTP
jgi:hypothetical protein